MTGTVTTWTPTLGVLHKAVDSGKNVIICREAPSYSRGERTPLFWRNGPAPSKELLDNDPVWQAKQEFISKNNLVIVRLSDWDARKTDGQLQGLARALGWDKFHVARAGDNAYDPRNVYFSLTTASLNSLAEGIKKKLNIQRLRVIGKPESSVTKVAPDECARWLSTFVSEVPIKFIPSGDPFWMSA